MEWLSNGCCTPAGSGGWFTLSAAGFMAELGPAVVSIGASHIRTADRRIWYQAAAAATNGDLLKGVPPGDSASECTRPAAESVVRTTIHRRLFQPAFALGDSMLAERNENVAFAHLCLADVACHASAVLGDVR
jgi:hypothetical protein